MAALMAHDIDEISMMLGDIKASLRSILADNSKLSNQIDEQEDTLRDLVSKLTSTAADVRLMRAEIDDMRPVTDDVKRWRTMGVGALTVTGIGAAWIGSNGAWLWQTAVNFFKTHS